MALGRLWTFLGRKFSSIPTITGVSEIAARTVWRLCFYRWLPLFQQKRLTAGGFFLVAPRRLGTQSPRARLWWPEATFAGWPRAIVFALIFLGSLPKAHSSVLNGRIFREVRACITIPTSSMFAAITMW